LISPSIFANFEKQSLILKTLKSRFKFILSSLIILSLIGFGLNSIISCPRVKSIKETEWVNTSNLKGKVTNCFYYSRYLNIAAEHLNIKTWSNEYILYYNQSINIKLISQINRFYEISPINLLINKSYIPRKSIEYHYVS